MPIFNEMGRLARQALERGDKVVLTARSPEKLTDLASKYGAKAIVLPLDVTDEAMIEKSVGDAEAHFGKVDVLVNNAG